MKIDGVLHEFSSIPGVKEDVTEIIMNLKNLAIKNVSDSNEPKTAYIEFEGEGVVTGADIQVDQDLEILNPDLVIATLNGGADSKLYIEMVVTNGRGYVSSDKNKKEEIKRDCEEESRIYIDSTEFMEGMGSIPMQKDLKNIVVGVNTRRGNPKGSRFIAQKVEEELLKYDDFIGYTTILRNRCKDSSIKKVLTDFISTEDFFFFYKIKKSNIILKMFFKEKDFNNE